ncbi:MAG TPA: hypothetical protein ENK04_01345 [Gammaproteobacteria bacterium]|nr:hypothetical protein [Gammaproteobacteria bacterium]
MQIPDKGLLAFNITTVLILKIVLIFALWLTFFSSPMDEELTTDSVAAWLLGPTTDIKEDVHGQ